MDAAREGQGNKWAYPFPIQPGKSRSLRQPYMSNPVFGQIAFMTASSALSELCDYPYLRHAGQDVTQDVYHNTLLFLHPIVQRSFATFPPASEINYHLAIPWRAENASGLTVLDVLHGMETM